MVLRARLGRAVQGIGPLRAAVALVGAALLTVAIVATVHTQQGIARQNLDHNLVTQAASEADSLEAYFGRARSIDLLLAHDAAFAELAAHSKVGSTRSVPVYTAETDEALAYLERLYPGRISEACFIDASGTEHARVVLGKVAPRSTLSHAEGHNVFFAPTMALAPGHVYQAAPYISQDTHRWVISDSTPVDLPDGRRWGVVHFEIELSTFRPVVTEGAARGTTVDIVDAAQGRELVASNLGAGAHAGVDVTGAQVGTPISPAERHAVATTSDISITTVAGRRMAAATVMGGAHNANHWVVTASAPAVTATWYQSLGLAPIAAALAALLMFLLVGLNLRAAHRRLARASTTDELTGLPNRRLMHTRLAEMVADGARRRTTSAVLLIDLDRFKQVNDTLGHHAGDLLLVEVADRLRLVLRANDTVARLGGDEFAILLPHLSDPSAATLLARRCVAALRQPFVIGGTSLHIDASIGVALSPHHGTDGAALLHCADVAMYEAKVEHRGVVGYDPERDENTPARLELVTDLRAAIEAGEIQLHYQPKLDLHSRQVHSVEALARWNHPVRGSIPPTEFVPIAERSGLILPMTMHVLDTAIARARGWLESGHEIQVAVNMSPHCLLAPNFADDVARLLAHHDLPCGLLRLELTESTIVSDPTRAVLMMSALREHGIALSIDDFGTGYSSMLHLKRLPVDELKIDCSFVTTMLADRNDSVLVRSSVALAHDLGLTVVAEGVEDADTLAALAALGCDVAQGYHLGVPMPAEQFEALLAQGEVDTDVA